MTYGAFSSVLRCFSHVNVLGSLAILTTGLCYQNLAYAKQTQLSTTLSNGLKVYIQENHRSPLVMVQVWYKVGAVDEQEPNLGISHALEHMMFKGTIRVPDDELKRINAKYGGSLNAFTTPNATYYYQLYPKDYLSLALELEADRMSNLYLRQKDFATEMKVVIEERRQRTDDNPQVLAFEKFRRIAYPTSRYRQPVIGYMGNLQKLSLTDLQHWYKKWYTPDNATVVVVGDVDVQQALIQIQRFFGDIPARHSHVQKNLGQRGLNSDKNSSSPLSSEHIKPSNQSILPLSAIAPDLLEAAFAGYRHLDDENPNVQVPNLYMAWNVPSLTTAPQAKDAYSLTLLKHILAGSLSARLNNELVKQRKLLTSINVSYDMINRGDTIFAITAIPAEKTSLQQAQQAITDMIEQLKSTPITLQELQRVQSHTLAQLIFGQDTLRGQAQLIGSFSVSGLDPQLIQHLPQMYQQLEPADIQHVIQRYLVMNNLATLYLEPIKQQKINSSESSAPPAKAAQDSKSEEGS